MLQKIIKYLLILLFFGLLIYNAIYFKKISEMQVSKITAFDAKAYAKTYLLEKIPAAKKEAVAIADLLSAMKKDSKKAFTNYSHFQNEGDTKYFFVKGEGKVTAIDEEFVTVKNTASGTEIKLAIQYIFDNTARDCSGLISIDDFSNTMDLNNVSEEINKLIKAEIVAPFIAKVKKGDSISFLGGIELSQSEPKTDKLEIIPLQLEINSK